MNESKGSSFVIRASGIVQGVGFRPFVHRIARKSGVKGYIRNMGGGEVEIKIEGSLLSVTNFIKMLFMEKPPPARLERVVIENSQFEDYKSFFILPSKKEKKIDSIIPPDIAVCDDCLREVYDPKDRHFRYPFNSCAWCGPRFSMMRDIPYDRENTAMKEFPLCKECTREYGDPDNIRRFHAQGISCPNCGPSLWLEDNEGRRISADDPISEAAKLIDSGKIVAIKGVGGYHIASLATDDDVIERLRERKERPSKPFALMALDLSVVDKHFIADDLAKEILRSPERPILLLEKRRGSNLSELIAPGLNTVGVMLPYTPLHHMLLKETRDRILIMTSGNKYGKPMCTDERCARERLSKIVDYMLHHNREIVNRVDDSVVRFTSGHVTMLRRGRGYAPAWIRLPKELKRPVIAFGAELQNTGAVAFSDKVVLTQYIGDTNELENLEFMEKMIDFFMSVYGISCSETKPILVADLHPTYASRKIAERWATQGCELKLIQHHYAHILSVMAESRITSRSVGIAIDGLGYGDDGTFWGGEVMIVDYNSYERVGGLRPQPMPGGDRATEYPVRMLIGILSTFMSENDILDVLYRHDLVNKLPGGELEVAISLRQASRGAPLISSIGRFLDAVSSYLGICYRRTYEGEPSMKLEAAATGGKLLDGVEVPTYNERIDTSRLMEIILEKEGEEIKDIAYSVLYVLGKSLGSLAARKASYLDTSYILVSGGAAVNSIIVRGIEDSAEEKGFKVKLNTSAPPGDGGIALGQVASQLELEDDL